MEKTIKKLTGKRKKRLGRGYGSGKGGHTSGRGQKGQKTRGKINLLFEGVKVKKSFIKRLPLRRGRGKFKAGKKPIIVKLAYLNLLPDKSKVSVDTLVKQGIVNGSDAKKYGVKVLGDGGVEKKLFVEVPISKSAGAKIVKAGGSVENKKD